MIIPRGFYERDTLTVARSLLGQQLVRRTAEGITRGIIVETEAYLGAIDDAAHSYRGKSERVRVQYGPAGCLYIYLIYGMYHCLNITTGPFGVPEVVLIRALEPASGIGLMQKRRGTDRLQNLCSGPGKLCMAMDIGKNLYGADLCTGGSIWLEPGTGTVETEASKRINVEYAKDAKENLWRFTVKGNRFVSKPPKR